MKPSEQPAEIPLSVQKGVVVADHVTGKLLDRSLCRSAMQSSCIEGPLVLTFCGW